MPTVRTSLARLVHPIAAVAAVLAVAACGSGTPSVAPATPLPVTPVPSAVAQPSTASGGAPGSLSCDLLGPSDFSAAGVDGARAPSDNPDGDGGHYCVYAGRSGATGGIELDVFPGADEATAADTYRTVVGEGPAGATATGATFSESSFAIDGDVAYLAVRQGSLVVALSAPNDMNTEAALVGLATLVVQRAGAAAP